MRITRLIAGTISAGLIGITPIALAGPAQADATYTTTASLATTSVLPVAYGDTLIFSGGIVDSAGSSDVPGTATLMVSSTKDLAWTAVDSDETGGNYTFYDVKPKSNSVYKVVYSGATMTSPLTGVNTWTPSESTPVEIGVKRTVKVSLNKLTIKAKVKPEYKRKKVIIKRIVGKKLRPYKKLRTNKKSVFKFRAPNRKGFKFAVIIPSDKHYTGWSSPYQVSRAPAARTSFLRAN